MDEIEKKCEASPRTRGPRYLDQTNYANYIALDAHGRPLDKNNDPLLQALKEGKR